jgi:hypothetical protein
MSKYRLPVDIFLRGMTGDEHLNQYNEMFSDWRLTDNTRSSKRARCPPVLLMLYHFACFCKAVSKEDDDDIAVYDKMVEAIMSILKSRKYVHSSLMEGRLEGRNNSFFCSLCALRGLGQVPCLKNCPQKYCADVSLMMYICMYSILYIYVHITYSC